MTPSPTPRQGLRIVRNHIAMFGVLSAIRAAICHALAPSYNPDTFDARYRTDTSDWVTNHEAQLPREFMGDAVQYEPVSEATVRHIMRSLPFDCRDFEFVDVGCGKGRTLMLASDSPWRRITGIELSPVTTAIAQRNIAMYTTRAGHRMRCFNVDVRCENAIDFHVPNGNVVCFLFNPFVGPVFERCMAHLHEAATMHPEREIWIVYVNPWKCEKLLERVRSFQRVAEHQVISRTWSWSLWKHQPREFANTRSQDTSSAV